MDRQLGTEERLFWSYAQLRPVHFTLTANIIGSLHLEELRQALAQVQHRHPLLNVKIALDRNEIPWFINDSVPIPVRVVERHGVQQWQQEVERELATPFDWSQAPLIRVVWLQGDDVSDLIITCDHALDLRPFLPTIAEDFGTYFTFILTADKVDPDRSVWELARWRSLSARESIKSQIDFKTTPAQIFAHIPNSEAFIATLPSPDEVVVALETVNRYDLNASNLGRLKIDRQYGECQLTAVYGPAITNHMDRAASVGVATLEERMFFSLVYPESNFSSAQIVGVASPLENRLQQTAMQFLN